jgi:hypothetical protein
MSRDCGEGFDAPPVERVHGARSDLVSWIYQYENSAALEGAIARARAQLVEEELDDDSGWIRFFVTRGMLLTVNVTIPAVAEHRFAAANVFLVLAHGAIHGAVEARRGTQTLDTYEAGAED